MEGNFEKAFLNLNDIEKLVCACPVNQVRSSLKREDVVNHPRHYMASNGIEAIDVIEGFTDPIAWNSGNVIKYVLRWKNKNGLEDLKKAQFYMNRLVRIVEDNMKEEAK